MTATSAVRDADNGREFLPRSSAGTGSPPAILTGEDEARMTFRGVTSAQAADGPVVVCDIGGGSTELIAGGPDGVDWATSVDIGCVRLSERFLTDDPPSAESLARAARAGRVAAARRWTAARDLIGVAGTITTLATIDLELEEEVPELIDGHVLSAATVGAELARLASLPLAERRKCAG